MNSTLQVNDVYLSTYHNADQADLFVIEEVVEHYVKLRKYNTGFTQYAKTSDFHESIKVKYGIVRIKHWFFFSKEYIERL